VLPSCSLREWQIPKLDAVGGIVPWNRPFVALSSQEIPSTHEARLSQRKEGRVVNVIVDFDAVNNILRATIEGRITGEILLNFHDAATKYLAAHPPCRFILDLSPVTDFAVSSDAIRRLAAAPPPLRSTGDVWILVIQKDVIYGLARMFQILTETKGNYCELHVVRTMDEAYRLLQVKCPAFRPVLL